MMSVIWAQKKCHVTSDLHFKISHTIITLMYLVDVTGMCDLFNISLVSSLVLTECQCNPIGTRSDPDHPVNMCVKDDSKMYQGLVSQSLYQDWV